MVCLYVLTIRLIESNTIEGGTRESHLSVQDLQSTTRFAELWMLQILDTRMGFLSPSLNVMIDYFSHDHSCLKMCKICLKCTLDMTFLDCLALMFCDVVGELLPEWACPTLLTSKLTHILVSRKRIYKSSNTYTYSHTLLSKLHFTIKATIGDMCSSDIYPSVFCNSSCPIYLLVKLKCFIEVQTLLYVHFIRLKVDVRVSDTSAVEIRRTCRTIGHFL